MRKFVWVLSVVAVCVWLIGCKLQRAEQATPPLEAPSPPAKVEAPAQPSEAQQPVPTVPEIEPAKYHPGPDLEAVAKLINESLPFAKEKKYSEIVTKLDVIARILSYVESHLASVILEQGWGRARALLDASDLKGAEAEIKRIKGELNELNAILAPPAMISSLETVIAALKAGDTQKARDEAQKLVSVDAHVSGLMSQMRESLILAKVAASMQRPRTIEAELTCASDALTELRNSFTQTALPPTTSPSTGSSPAPGGSTPSNTSSTPPVPAKSGPPAPPSPPSSARSNH